LVFSFRKLISLDPDVEVSLFSLIEAEKLSK
jgi:hypothetical protein